MGDNDEGGQPDRVNVARIIDGHDAATPALISRNQTITYGELAEQRRPAARRPRTSRHRRRRPRGDHLRQRPPVRHRLPRAGRDGRRGRAAEPVEPGARAAASAGRRRRGRRRRRPQRRGDVAQRRPGRAPDDPPRGHGRRRSRRWRRPDRRAAHRRPVAGRRSRPRSPRRAVVHQRHGGCAPRGDAHPRQPAGEHRAGALGARSGCAGRRRLRGHPAVPHLRAQRRPRHQPVRRRDGRARPALRPGDRPGVDPLARRDGDPRRTVDVGRLRPLRGGARRRLRHGAGWRCRARRSCR